MPGLSSNPADKTYDIDPYGHTTRSEFIIAFFSFLSLILVSIFSFMPEVVSYAVGFLHRSFD